MAVLSWGKPKIEKAVSTDGTPGTWTAMDTPKQDTTKLTGSAGSETTAIEEGGAIVDVKYEKTTYTLEMEFFMKKGGTAPFEDEDGVVVGNYAFRITPEDASCYGVQIDNASVRSETSYSSSDGIIVKVTAKALKPKTGKMVKLFKGDSTPA